MRYDHCPLDFLIIRHDDEQTVTTEQKPSLQSTVAISQPHLAERDHADSLGDLYLERLGCKPMEFRKDSRDLHMSDIPETSSGDCVSAMRRIADWKAILVAWMKPIISRRNHDAKSQTLTEGKLVLWMVEAVQKARTQSLWFQATSRAQKAIASSVYLSTRAGIRAFEAVTPK